MNPSASAHLLQAMTETNDLYKVAERNYKALIDAKLMAEMRIILDRLDEIGVGGIHSNSIGVPTFDVMANESVYNPRYGNNIVRKVKVMGLIHQTDYKWPLPRHKVVFKIIPYVLGKNKLFKDWHTCDPELFIRSIVEIL